jgi:hypothetical protein
LSGFMPDIVACKHTASLNERKKAHFPGENGPFVMSRVIDYIDTTRFQSRTIASGR